MCHIDLTSDFEILNVLFKTYIYTM